MVMIQISFSIKAELMIMDLQFPKGMKPPCLGVNTWEEGKVTFARL